MATPYLELVEEMTSLELIDFHSRFKKLSVPAKELLENAGLASSAAKQVRYFSSGMKQRLKLALSFFSLTPVILLDEPITNLDKDGIALYHSFIKHAEKKLIIVSSNDEQEYQFCNNIIRISDYK